MKGSGTLKPSQQNFLNPTSISISFPFSFKPKEMVHGKNGKTRKGKSPSAQRSSANVIEQRAEGIQKPVLILSESTFFSVLSMPFSKVMRKF